MHAVVIDPGSLKFPCHAPMAQHMKLNCVRSTVLSVIAASAALATAQCQAVPVTVGSYAVTGMGAEFASPYDSFSINGNSFDVPLPDDPLTMVIGTYDFEVGPNCYSCTLTPSFDALIDVTVGGTTRHLDMPFAWSSSGPIDSLTFASVGAISFELGVLGTLSVAANVIPLLSAGSGSRAGNVTATISLTPIPEPGSAALLLGGLALIVYTVRRRRRG